MRILGISGSVRRGSHNLTLLRAAEAQLPPNAELEAWRGVADLPAYDENLDAAGAPVAVTALRLAISRADAVIGASTGLFGAVWAQAELRKVLTTIGANVINRELAVGQAHDAFDEHGRVQDPHLRDRLAEIVATLLDRSATSPQASASPTA
jgi:chromate reductase